MILCAVCKRPVDWTEMWEDPIRMSTHVRAHCHGQVDQCEITDIFIIEAGAPLTNGIAFATPQISQIQAAA